jgi:hypothetical protein
MTSPSSPQQHPFPGLRGSAPQQPIRPNLQNLFGRVPQMEQVKEQAEQQRKAPQPLSQTIKNTAGTMAMGFGMGAMMGGTVTVIGVSLRFLSLRPDACLFCCCREALSLCLACTACVRVCAQIVRCAPCFCACACCLLPCASSVTLRTRQSM